MIVLKEQVEEELRKRKKAMTSMLAFTEYTFPGYKVNWHHKAICDALDQALEGKVKRLMIFAPPRHGKSELISRRFPAMAMGRDPDTKVIATSYSDDLAKVNNRDVQRIMTSDEYALLFPHTQIGSTRSAPGNTKSGVKNSDEFEIIGRRGGYISAGIGGGITGKGGNILLVDDPIKNRQEADSKTYRDRLEEWYKSVLFTRRADDNAAIIIVLTRWHHDDLAGRLLEQAPDDWTVISLPAIKDTLEGETSCACDPRKEGEALWPGLFDIAALKEIEKLLGNFNFAALYQQRPVPRSGNLFKTAKLQLVETIPYGDIVKSIRYWDKAGSVGSGCMTAGVLIHQLKNGQFMVADVVAGQWGALERETRMLQTARLDGKRPRIWCEQEPGSGGKESAEATVRHLRGFIVHADKVTGDKVSRAEPFASQVEAGNVLVLNRDWTKAYIDELEMYPSGKFLDKTDASAGAFNKLVYKRISPHVGGAAQADERAVEEANKGHNEFEDILAQAATPEERAALEKILQTEGIKT